MFACVCPYLRSIREYYELTKAGRLEVEDEVHKGIESRQPFKETFEAVYLSRGLVGFLTCCLTAYLVPAVIRLVGCDANS